jgi:hypothetical protein
MSDIQIEDGSILKNGETIGSIQDGVAVLTTKVSNQDKGAIRKAAGDDSLSFKVVNPEEDSGDEEESPAEEAPKKNEPKPYKADGYPIPQGQDPRKGTKTPGWKGGKA